MSTEQSTSVSTLSAVLLISKPGMSVWAPQSEFTDVEFIEFAVEGDSGAELVALLQSLGFRETHRHHFRNISLMRKGDINQVLNREPLSQAHEQYQASGVSICMLAFATTDLTAMIAESATPGLEGV